MFDGVEKKLNLKLTRTRAFGNGNVLLCYEPVGVRGEIRRWMEAVNVTACSIYGRAGSGRAPDRRPGRTWDSQHAEAGRRSSRIRWRLREALPWSTRRPSLN